MRQAPHLHADFRSAIRSIHTPPMAFFTNVVYRGVRFMDVMR
jgi:hypothetical protein